ncbi:Dihydrolipoamide acetyltransferase, long form [Ascosphaera apis ARSEF 7405]|uniref:Acetyltransferase component of pyruvate dehydrogenase complex n=1 Tax=Ascosphaera apis ARSEF 7405 TaxID=392613 RepID=A0A167UVA4_9EURO|nr:Dihydrolipoamide acetyltransferase, long form [Ascosphaera apis ARSEF 7405]
MTAGNIGAWQKKPGDNLQPGDVLVEIETDKAQMDFEFQEEGTLAKILREAGEKDVPVGNPIAVMVEEGAEVSAFADFTLEDAGGGKPDPAEPKKEEGSPASSPASSSSSAEQSTPSAQESGSAATEQPQAIEPENATIDRLEAALEREALIAPGVKNLALEKGVPLKAIKGTGPGGRITREDVEKYTPPATSSSSSGASAPVYEDLEVSNMRKTIANRLKQSTQQNPHYFVSSTLNVTRLLKLRQALNESANGAYKLSVNDFLVKALSKALLKVPAANSHWIEENGKTVIRQHSTVDISVAVATPSGLITPIVKNVQGLGLSSISSAVKDLSKRARDNKLKPEEYSGGTFTISNMGMNPAVERFTAIINPPQAGILAVGTTVKQAVPAGEDGEGVEWQDVITVTGSFDHKVVDGAVGGEFMRELKRVVENPLELML